MEKVLGTGTIVYCAFVWIKRKSTDLTNILLSIFESSNSSD